MHKFYVYITFEGTCEEAINFYQSCFGGKIEEMIKYSDYQLNVPDSHKNKIVHSKFVSEDFTILASDGMPDYKAPNPSNVSICLNMFDEKKQDALYDKLSEGGIRTLPPKDMFWNARLSMLTDKFGINWMLSVREKKT